MRVEGAVALVTGASRGLGLEFARPEDVAAVARRCGDVTLLINNAGVLQAAPLLAPENVPATRAQFETNFFGTLAMAGAFAPVLAANGGGAIVNVLSVLSWVNLRMTAGYSASKAATWALTNGLRNELRAQGTLVVAVHAAFIETEMARNIRAPKLAPADVVTQVLAAIEAGRDEVLADETTRRVKMGFNGDPPVYLREASGAA
jgi:NAD(P)-dependent dehydrogenase (short-subunit alcohol dehydrogenase family)